MNEILQHEHNTIITVRKNLKKLMEVHNIKPSNFCEYLKNQQQPSISRSTFSRFINGVTNKINIAFLVSCSHVFGVSLDSLISPNFNPNENYLQVSEKLKDIPKEDNTFNIFDSIYPISNFFIENPTSPLLEKYIQTYHCYYYSTVAAENNTGNIKESLISGTLEIEAHGEKCKATLKINTKTLDEAGNPHYKIYSGNAVLCLSTRSIHCILTLPTGEFCFISFRYSHLNYKKQECRIAEVLSTSSIPDKRYPIVHRMLLTNQEIKEKDLVTIAPHLCLNSTDILISETELLDLSKKSHKVNLIIQELLKTDSKRMYCVTENTLKEISKNYLAPEEIPVFITEFRSHSLAKRYNKVSTGADEAIRNVLLQKGYFKKDSTT